MHKFIRLAFLALTFLALILAASYAQASIAGVVRDTSGAVLPGVSVEAASPALIEKVRTAVTDGAGRAGRTARGASRWTGSASRFLRQEGRTISSTPGTLRK
jgi:hypothetical protein